METPNYTHLPQRCFAAYAKPSQTRALVEESEIFHEKSNTIDDLEGTCGIFPKSFCLIQASMTTTDETVVEEEGERQEVITFNDKSQSVSVAAQPICDESMYDGFSANVDLATYLARPVLIQSYDWVQGSIFPAAIFYPWKDYFNTA